MRGSLVALFGLSLALSAPVLAQSDDHAYTPLGSRIARSIPPDEMVAVNKERKDSLLGQFAECIYDKNRDAAHSLIASTDYGWVRLDQVGLTSDEIVRTYQLSDCLGRVADRAGRSMNLGTSPSNVRAMLIQQAYFDLYPDGPGWYHEGFVPAPRQFPLSADVPGVRSAMAFADCVLTADPVNADFFYRSATDSEGQTRALAALTPSLGPCLVQGQELRLTPSSLRILLGEALWHAAVAQAPSSAPVPAEEVH